MTDLLSLCNCKVLRAETSSATVLPHTHCHKAPLKATVRREKSRIQDLQRGGVFLVLRAQGAPSATALPCLGVRWGDAEVEESESVRGPGLLIGIASLPPGFLSLSHGLNVEPPSHPVGNERAFY